MIYFNLGFIVLLFIGLIACRSSNIEYLSELDKKEHRLYIVYPFADWLLRITGFGKVLSGKSTVNSTIKALYHTSRPEVQSKLYWCKQISLIIVILLLSNLLSMMSQLSSGNSVLIRGRYLERPPIGASSKQQELKVTLEDNLESSNRKEKGEEHTRDILINIPARRYRQEEVSRLFSESTRYLETAVLGNNESKELIYENINLFGSVPGTGITVEWIIEDLALIQSDGTVANDKLDLKGKVTTITAVLSYGEYKAEHTFDLHIMPRQYSENEVLKQRLETAIDTASEQSAYEEWMELPEAMEDYRLIWSQKESNIGVILLLMGTIAAVLVWLYGNKDLNKRMKLRKDQLILDYPEVVNKFTLLVNAGMTARQAFSKISEDYERKYKDEKLKKRYAYEEMRNTVREMKLGLPEGLAYDQYGRRIGLVSYIKFGSLISQNLKKGNKGFTELLVQEGCDAFEERKEAAKRLGEEASAKLLIPMFIMLIIVFLLILIPAFMSFGI